MASELTTRDHARDNAGLRYVYPVVSRRARGVSVGVNLNPNNACNWRCAYCQVPGLVRGKGPVIELDVLRAELAGLLGEILEGDFFERRVPEGLRRLNDVAFSGNGEPTSSPNFAEALEVVAEVLREAGVQGTIKIVLITNGSLADQPAVVRALERMNELNGEVWFKLDRATREGMRETNDTAISPDAHLERLIRCAARCPTWVQTCMFARGGEPPSPAERAAYLAAIARLAAAPTPPAGVLLYGLARESHQPEAEQLSALSAEWLDSLGRDIEAAGLPARVSH